MADRICITDGNLTTAGTWAVNDATGTLISTNTGSTTLTTGNLDSATFTPGAINIHGVLLRLAGRAAGSPSNTLTVILRNSTDGIDVATIVVNVSDLPAATAGAGSEGGWHFFRISGGLTLTAAKAYLIRLTLSATTTAVSFCTNGTANNWQRVLITQTTGAPAAGDDMHVCQQFLNSTSPATRADHSVTMDQTAATDYGSAQTSAYVAALDVSKGGTVIYDTTINSLLRLSGHLKVYSGGTFKQGASGAEIPRNKTSVLEFDCAAADQDFYFQGMSGAVVRAAGLSRTSGKNISQTLLTADLAAAGTTSTVADDTGWLTGDAVAYASTTRTATQAEDVTLTGDAGASSFTHGAVANAHRGTTTNKYQAEVLLLERNVMIRSVSSTFMSAFVIGAGIADCVVSWVSFRYCGGSGTVQAGAVNVSNTTGSAAFSHCIVRDTDRTGWLTGGSPSTGSMTFDNCHVYKFGVVSASGDGFHTNGNYNGATTAVLSFTNCTAIGDNTTGAGFRQEIVLQANWAGANYIVTNMRLNSCDLGIDWEAHSDQGGASWGPFYIHSLSGDGMAYVNTANVGNVIFTGDFYVWRCTGQAIDFSSANLIFNTVFSGPVRLSGNGTANIQFQSPILGLRFVDLGLYGDSTFSTGFGMNFVTGPCLDILIDKLDSGTASGDYVAHATADLNQNAAACRVSMVIRRATLASATEFNGFATFGSFSRPTYFGIQRKDADGVHFTITDLGRIDIETTTVDATPGLKMTPIIPTGYQYRLDTSGGRRGRGYLVPVANGGAVTVSVKVRKDGSYTGAAPRLLLRANPAIGIDADVVGDTLSVGADTWETLTYTTAAVTDAGVLEFVVDCGGDAGAVYVDSWSQTGGATTITSMQYWLDGLPLDILPSGSPGLQARSYPFMG